MEQMPYSDIKLRFTDLATTGLCLGRSALLDSVPCARGHVFAESLLDERHEYGSARAWNVRGEDLAAVYAENARAIDFARER